MQRKISLHFVFSGKSPIFAMSTIFETGEKARRIAGIFYALSYRIVPSRVER